MCWFFVPVCCPAATGPRTRRRERELAITFSFVGLTTNLSDAATKRADRNRDAMPPFAAPLAVVTRPLHGERRVARVDFDGWHSAVYRAGWTSNLPGVTVYGLLNDCFRIEAHLPELLFVVANRPPRT